jgi:hypothetical protein
MTERLEARAVIALERIARALEMTAGVVRDDEDRLRDVFRRLDGHMESLDREIDAIGGPLFVVINQRVGSIRALVDGELR